MIKINLIPPEYIDKLNRRAIIAKAVAAGVITAALVVFLSVWHFTQAKTIELKMGRLQVELKNLQGDVDRVKAIEAQIAEVQRYLDAINSITGGRLIYTRFMQDLLAALPGTIWFTGVSTTLKDNTIAVTLPVNSHSIYDLAYWINALETDPKYSGVEIGGIAVNNSDTGKVLSTNLTLTYAYR
ncbi:MAG: hypothetical protein WCW52_07250 [Elusimicrobiales bacterium]|jgi:Tfp pilus assembly protein PilN